MAVAARPPATLELRRRSRFGSGGASHLTCINECRRTESKHGNWPVLFASYVAFILGLPVGGLCERCARSWRRDWADNGGGVG